MYGYPYGNQESDWNVLFPSRFKKDCTVLTMFPCYVFRKLILQYFDVFWVHFSFLRKSLFVDLEWPSVSSLLMRDWEIKIFVNFIKRTNKPVNPGHLKGNLDLSNSKESHNLFELLEIANFIVVKISTIHLLLAVRNEYWSKKPILISPI